MRRFTNYTKTYFLATTRRESQCSVGWITVPSEEVANKITNVVLENKLVACVNIVPGITSKYWWNGKIESDNEILLMVKTRSDLAEELISTVKANHPYETPEIVLVPIKDGNAQYLKWIIDSTTPTK